MIKKLLIANRGEIALRIIRTCKMLDIATVAVHSTADRDSLPVKLADESVCIGPEQAKLSYLNIAAIISAAEITGADAIHPGYGFLSENSEFAAICEQCGIKFVGPTSKTISLMGNKIAARQIAIQEGVPLLPGSPGPVRSVEEAVTWAKKIGYPVILKAAAGGGGRGIQVVFKADDLPSTFHRLGQEALLAFGSSDLYVEKFLQNPKHVEIQVMADSHGNYIYLGERDCSAQRKKQKIIEEAPCVAIDDKTRKKMGEAAMKLARSSKYENAGTVEFLLDGDGSFYFMEMNTRLQVEHPVTEMVTGLNLVKEQIQVANGGKLTLQTQDQVKISGHAIECRINAEHPWKLTPSPGKVLNFHMPSGMGIRMDTYLYAGCKVVPFYDSMVGKLIVHDETRELAIKKLKICLEECIVDGIHTNIALHKRIIEHPIFVNSKHTINFLEEMLKSINE